MSFPSGTCLYPLLKERRRLSTNNPPPGWRVTCVRQHVKTRQFSRIGEIAPRETGVEGPLDTTTGRQGAPNPWDRRRRLRQCGIWVSENRVGHSRKSYSSRCCGSTEGRHRRVVNRASLIAPLARSYFGVADRSRLNRLTCALRSRGPPYSRSPGTPSATNQVFLCPDNLGEGAWFVATGVRKSATPRSAETATLGESGWVDFAHGCDLSSARESPGIFCLLVTYPDRGRGGVIVHASGRSEGVGW